MQDSFRIHTEVVKEDAVSPEFATKQVNAVHKTLALNHSPLPKLHCYSFSLSYENFQVKFSESYQSWNNVKASKFPIYNLFRDSRGDVWGTIKESIVLTSQKARWH